jgi:hypothetical protein
MGRARLGPGSSLKELQAVLSKPEIASAISAPEPVERIVEVIKEVPVEVIRYVDREVIKEVIEEVPVIVTKEIEVIKEVPVEVIKEVIVQVEKQVEVIKEVEVRVPYIQHMVPRWCRWTILLAVVELVVIGLLLEAAK